MPTIDEIAAASKDGHVRYEIIEYKGIKLLITTAKLQSLIETTWEFTGDPAAQKLAEEMGIELRRRLR